MRVNSNITARFLLKPTTSIWTCTCGVSCAMNASRQPHLHVYTKPVTPKRRMMPCKSKQHCAHDCISAQSAPTERRCALVHGVEQHATSSSSTPLGGTIASGLFEPRGNLTFTVMPHRGGISRRLLRSSAVSQHICIELRLNT